MRVYTPMIRRILGFPTLGDPTQKSRPKQSGSKRVEPLSTLPPRDLHIVLAAFVLRHLSLGMNSLTGNLAFNFELAHWS